MSIMKNDHVDGILAQWKKERPDIDPSPMGIIGRVFRLNKIFNKELQTVFDRYKLNFAEFDLLAVLLRTGSPYSLTPNQLLASLMLTSGAMTNRIDKLEARKLVERQPDPNDRRGILVTLSQTGFELISAAIKDHVDNERLMLDNLSASQQKTLSNLLKKTLLKYET